MTADFTVGQNALVVLAIATSIQTLVLLVGAWMAIRVWNDLSVKLERRLDSLQAGVETVADAAQHLAGTIEGCVNKTSTALQLGERLATAMASTVAPKTLLLAGVASKLLSSWRRRRRAGVAGLSTGNKEQSAVDGEGIARPDDGGQIAGDATSAQTTNRR